MNNGLDKNLNNLLDISIALSAETDTNAILKMILKEAREITKADAGTIYLLSDDKLEFTITQNDTLKVDCVIDENGPKWPPVKLVYENVSAYVALTGESLSIDDVYDNNDFDFSGPAAYDRMTGYHTKSMLVLPLKNHENDVVGVIQLINAQNDANEVISFDESSKKIILSLASQAAISMTKMKLIEELENTFRSFVEVMVTALDEQTKYNANHSRNMVQIMDKFILHINRLNKIGKCQYYFDNDYKEKLLMCVWLHDIGKVAVPIEIMNKPTRLGTQNDIEFLYNRLELIKSKLYIQHLKALADPDSKDIRADRIWWQEKSRMIDEAKSFIEKVNGQNVFIDEKMAEKLKQINNMRFDGIEERVITEKEFENLSIVKGTLTSAERSIIQGHLTITKRMLEKMRFKKYYSDITDIVSKHHEFLDGSGYPLGLTAENIQLESRMITITDIYESLTSTDRPYKKTFSPEKAFSILKEMASFGKLDRHLVDVFIDSVIAEGGVQEIEE